MSRKDDSGDQDRNPAEQLWNIERRRVLQLAGAGVAGLGMTGAGSGVASAATDCADGPFERTYEGGTVNFAQIQSEQGAKRGPPDMSTAEPGGRDKSGEPPYGRARGQQGDEGDGELEIGTEYEGLGSNDTRGGVPSDSQIATGRSKNVHAVNQQVAIYNKQSGTKQRQVDLEDIWEPVIPEPEGGFALGYPFVFDPRARYDRNEDRFVLCATQFVMGLTADGEMIGKEEVEEGEVDPKAVSRAPRGYFVVAVSQSSNPNGTWNVYRLPPEDADGPDVAGLVDYPTLGLDQDAIYLTQNFFANDGSFTVTMVTLDKAEVYAGEPVTAHHFDNMNNPGEDAPFTFTVQPAFQPFSGGSSGTYYMVNSGFTSDALTLWEVTDPTTNPSLSCYTVDVEAYSPPPTADQPNTDSTIDTIGSRLMNADYNLEDGSLWTAHTVAAEGDDGVVAAIRWYEIDVESRELVQSGTYGEPDKSYYIPTVKSYEDATIIVHNVSGPDTFARMDVAGRTADFTPGEIEDSVAIQDGESKYNALPGPVERWGDYNGASLDPQTKNFWTVSQYSPNINIPVDEETRDPYATRIAEVFFDDEL
ncbi:hypothetical protein [Halococcus sp. AFM35]|uniref:hypothetical protein n=1 Tax=Halococcus sp. AFM35 TaxID=3421653 RepID=UPI003EBBA7E4